MKYVMQARLLFFFILHLLITRCMAMADWGFVEGLNNDNNNAKLGRSCRCLPGRSCWPSLVEWQQLNTSVEGRLLAPKPSAAPCHDPSYNPSQCEDVRANWYNPFWRSSESGSLQYPNYESLGTQTCLPFDAQNATCFQGSVPVYAVDALNTAHIQTSVKFASLHNLRLVVKSTGHDLLGRSTAPGSFLIWTHHFNKHSLHPHFTSLGCPKDSNKYPSTFALTVQGGVRWVDVNEDLVSNNLIMMFGFPQDLSAAGGFVQGGGHSPLSPSFGLCADNVIQFEVVIADGSLKVANQCQNKELFWALRGGGGATFGVVVSATHRTYPDFQRYIWAQIMITSNDKESIHNITSKFLLLHPHFSDIGWSGYFSLTNNTLVIYYLLVNNTNVEMARQDFSELFDYANNNKLMNITTDNFTIFNNYHTWRNTLACAFNPGTCEISLLNGYNILIGSRLIPRLTLENPKDTSKLTKAFFEILATQGISMNLVGMFVAGGNVSKPRDNSVNPAWRSALLHMFFYSSYEFGANRIDIAIHTKSFDYGTKLLTDLTPSSGAYANEASYNEPNWQQSLFGSNYPRLKHIKDYIDPKGLFVCHHCVGSEEWTEDLNCPSHAL